MLLFNGDSWTHGANLEDRDERFACVLSKRWKEDFIDLSEAGCSNRKIYRKTIEQDLSDISLGIICMTFKNRTEFFLKGKWENINPGRGGGKKFLDYYKNYYEEEYGESDEKIYRQAIVDHFEANNTSLLLLTVSKESTFEYDLCINTPDIPLTKTMHPTKEGHLMIAERIVDQLV